MAEESVSVSAEVTAPLRQFLLISAGASHSVALLCKLPIFFPLIVEWKLLFLGFSSNGNSVVRMSTPARKRLMRDFKRLQQDPPAGISGASQDNNIMLWNAVIFGPDDTPWDGGKVNFRA
ncbi:hypothetical protein FCV25MIE_29840 [Fagus crenata]